MQNQIVIEGSTKLEVPDLSKFRTPAGDYAPSLTPVFYNPRMELCRDISVSLVQVLANELGGIRICDPLAGVGARGLRYAMEVRGVERAIINDRSQEAVEYIRRNVELNGLGNVEVHAEDANVLLWSHRGKRFHFIDVDPFGSPAPFVDAACAALARGGILALTATDTAPLSGAHVKACLRRYGARPLKTEYCHELGVRILIGFAQRVAGKHELALVPVLTHSTEHYFRIYLRAAGGAQRVDEILGRQGHVSHCRSCGRRVVTCGIGAALSRTCECGEKFEHAGPMWLGQLVDKEFIRKVYADLGNRNFTLGCRELVLLYRCIEEAGGPPTFYDHHDLSRRAGVSAPKLLEVISKLRGMGYFASRTHFSDVGLRTNAPLEELLEVFRGFSVIR
jgi:tRNA (guanine26-N2/guanine27-N2)-dimethyltransferase